MTVTPVTTHREAYRLVSSRPENVSLLNNNLHSSKRWFLKGSLEKTGGLFRTLVFYILYMLKWFFRLMENRCVAYGVCTEL